MKRMMTTVGGLAMVFVLVLPPRALAHGIDMYARVEGGQIVGSLASSDGLPIANAPVRALAPEGMVLAEVQTDNEGRFFIPIRHQVQYRLEGDGGEGHRGVFIISKSEIEAGFDSSGQGPPAAGDGTVGEGGAATSTDTTRLEAAISRQLGPLRDQLHAHEARVRFRDVLGGIGYVFGLAGLYVLLKQQRGPKPPEHSS